MPRKVKFLGIEFDIVSDTEMKDAPVGTIYMMSRVADFNGPDWGTPDLRRRRRKELCEGCGAVCWFDPKSYGSLPGHVTRLCIQCVQARAGNAAGQSGG